MKEVKSPTTLDEQVEKLKSKGLIIDDVNFAKEFLYTVNYYNFSGYLFDFKSTDGFFENLTFNKVHNIYMCDKRLKSIILYATEIIEHNIKTKFSHIMAHQLGSLGYKDKNNFTNEQEHQKMLQFFERNVDKNSKLPFVKHHLKEYKDFPIWVAIELFTLGNVASCYKNIRKDIKKTVAFEFNTNFICFENWLDSVVYLRNMSAHYMRLYNLNIPITPKTDKTHFNNFKPTHKIFDIIYIMKLLMPNKLEWNNYILSNIQQIFDEYKEFINLDSYGFPEDWLDILKK